MLSMLQKSSKCVFPRGPGLAWSRPGVIWEKQAFWSLSAFEQLQGRITSGISDVFPECGVAPHSVEHLFNCQSHLTQLTVQDHCATTRPRSQTSSTSLTDDRRQWGYHNNKSRPMHVDIVAHLFNYQSHLTQLTVQDLCDLAEVADFLTLHN